MKCALLIFYAAGTLAAPFLVLNDNLPGAEVKEVGCSSSRFQQGSSYAYDYAGETLSNVEGASTQWTGLKMTSRVYITPLSECKFSMKLSNSQLFSKSRNQEFVRSEDSNKLQVELEKHELLFTMNGDKIHSLVAHNMEPVHILNMKRGILSTLQVDKDSQIETDVNGVCRTTVTMEDGKVVETKKLSDCIKRAKNVYGIQTASFKTDSSIKPLDSTSKCTYTMDGDKIEQVSCDETHIFRPFSAGYERPSGAMTVVRQNLRKVSAKPSLSEVKFEQFTKQTSLVFDHTEEETKSTNAMATTAESIMTSLVQKNSLSAKQDSAHEFTALVMVLRKMNKKAMTPIWEKYFDCVKSGTCSSSETDLQGVYRQYLLDAIAYCGTPTCVSFVRSVIIDGKVSGERVNMFLQSIALVGQTAKNMIKDVLEIAQKQPSRQAFLSLGTLINRHCNKSPKECEFEKRNPISEAEVFLENKLGESCQEQESHERVEEILMALKSIGNARRPLRVRGALLKCAEASKHSNITHSAFSAFQNMQCDGQFTEQLLNFIKNKNIDPEKRIHAFAAAMKCPNEYVLERLIKMLEDEPSRQVASFMWSHLTNTMESSDPTKKMAKEILGRLTKTTPLRVVNLGIHQYSRFFEKSMHSKTVDTGATAEGQVIYHPDGYLPRTGKLNVKATVLGQSIDVFETMVHMEGIEDLVEDALGPNGVLPKDFLLNIFNYTMTSEKLREFTLKRAEQTRTRRGAKMAGKLNTIHDQVNMKPSKPTAHFNIKVMGQEIRVMSYDDLFWMIDQIDNSNVIQMLVNVAKGGHKTFSKSMMFLEMSHVVPTGVGMPLRLKLTGSTVTTVELDGKFDIRNMFWGPGSVTIKGYVKPSAVVEISGQMGIESAFGSSGIFVNSSMFVSHMTKGNIIYKQGQLLKINIDTPGEPVQLFNVSSTPFMYMNEKVDLIEGTARRISPDYCIRSKIIGYGLCTSLRLPVAFREYESPYFPLSGPAHFGVNLVRGDEGLTTYQFQVKMEKNGKELVGDMEFSTPGAYYERKLGGKMRYSDVWNQKTLTLSTEKNGKTAQLELSYNPNTKRSYIEGKTNFFTPKLVVSRMEVFNTHNMVSDQYGLTYTLSYDWYKFEHVTKFVKKDTGYMVHSSTEYYPKKSAIGVLEYSKTERKLSARFDANQIKQSFEVSGQMTTSGVENGLKIIGTHLTSGKSASLYFGYANAAEKQLIFEADIINKKARSTLTYKNSDAMKSVEAMVTAAGKTGKMTASMRSERMQKTVAVSCMWNNNEVAVSNIILTNKNNERSIFMTATAASKTVQSKVGYYKTSSEATVKAEIDLVGRKAEVFFNVLSSDGLTYTLGGIAGQYSTGLRSTYTTGAGQTACLAAYYGTKDSPKEPGKACVNVKSLSQSFTHKRLSVFLDLQKYGKVGEVVIEAKNEDKITMLSTAVNYKEKEVAKEVITLTYTNMMEAELSYRLTVSQYNGDFKLFTRVSGDEKHIGAEGRFMEKSIMLINKLRSNKMGKAVERSFTTELIVNGKVLPVSTSLNLLSEEGVIAPSASLSVGKYGFTYATAINYLSSQYSLLDEVVVSKDSTILTKFYRKLMLQMSKEKKELSYKYGLVAFEKTYEYGWEAAYQNRGTLSKSAHEITLALQYSTTRKSSVTFTLSNGKKTAEVLVNVEYIPGKTLMHSVTYNKNLRQLDISIEFLPKMHTKFMARLDKKNGYKFTTDFAVQWKKYKRSMQMVNTIKNTKQFLDMSTSIGKNFKVGMTYTKTSPKSLQFGAKIMKHTFKLTTKLTKKLLRVSMVKNARVLFNVGVGLQRVGRSIKFSILNGRNTIFFLTGDYNRIINQVKLSARVGKKEMISVTGRLNKKQAVATLLVKGKPVFKVTAKKSNDMVSLKLAAPRLKRDVQFAVELNRNLKSVTLSASSGKHRLATEVRADLKNMIVSLDGFYNNDKVGVKTFVKDSSLVYKLTLAPTVSMKVTFEMKNDRVLRMKVERQAGKQLVNEFQTQFKLSRKMSQFAINWNTKYFKKLANRVTPVVKSYMRDMAKTLKDLRTESVIYVKKSAKEMKRAAFDFVDTIDNKFDSINFVKIRDNAGKTAMKGMRSMSKLTRQVMKQLIKALNNIKRELPAIRRRIEKVTIDSIKYLRTLPAITEKNMKELQARLNEVQVIFMKVAKNLTESSRPVVLKAIELAKKFKLRGKTMEELVVLIKVEGQKYITMYTRKAEAELKKLQVKALELYDQSKTRVLRMKIPYRKETVAEAIEIILAKVEELKQRIQSIDAKKLVLDARTFVMNYKVKGARVSKHIETLQGKLNELKANSKHLPEKTKKLLHKLIKLVREYRQQAVVIYQQVADFGKPMTDYVVLVKNSAVKRFGPLYRDAATMIESQIGKIELPDISPFFMTKLTVAKRFMTPIFAPLKPFSKTMVNQIRALNVMGFTLGTTVDMNMQIVNNIVEIYINKAQTMVTKRIEIVSNYVDKYNRMTPEQMVDMAFDSSTKMSKKVVDYATKMYESREKMVKTTVADLKKVYQQLVTRYETLRAEYNKFTSQTPEEVLQAFYQNTEGRIVAVVEELITISEQLAALEVSKPTWRAWKQADLLGHFERYGVNARVSGMILTLKEVKLTRAIMDFVKYVKKMYNAVYSQAFVKAIRAFNKFETVYDYVRSIPKKEYEEWYAELRQFAVGKKEMFVNFVQTKYQVTKERAIELYEMTKTMSTKNYNMLYADYAVPAKKVYERAAQQSKLFYDDVKQPTMDVSKHYYDIAREFTNKHYEPYRDLMVELAEQARDEVNTKYLMLVSRAEEEYTKFLNKYGDMTWEQIGEKMVALGEKKAMEVKSMYKKQSEVVEKLVMKYRKEALKLYKKAEQEYQKYVAKFNDEIKPKLMAKYNQIKIKYNAKVNELKVKYEEYRFKVEALVQTYRVRAMEMIKKIQETGMTIYNNHKDKPLKTLYLEIKGTVVAELNQQYSKIVRVYNMKSQEVSTMAKSYYNKADKLVRKVLPEVEEELVSIINQTLKNTVVMTEEVIKAYTPHFNLVKREVGKVSNIVSNKAALAYTTVVAELTTAAEQAVEESMKLMEQMKEHKYTKRAVAEYKKALKHKYVSDAKVALKKVVKMLKEKIEELKEHPTTKKYQRKLNVQVRKLKKEAVQIYKKLQKQMKEMKNDKRVKKIINISKQVQKSAKFTVNKMIEKIRPHYVRLVKAIQQTISLTKSNAKNGFKLIRSQPDEAFWRSIATMRKYAREIYNTIRSFDKEQMRNTMIYKEVAATTVDEMFDEWTKKSANYVYKSAVKTAKDVKVRASRIPREVRQMAMKNFRQAMRDLRQMYKDLQKSYRQSVKTLVGKWNNCPYKAFVDNEIWRDVAGEISNHEITEAVYTVGKLTQRKVIQMKVLAIKEARKQQKIVMQKLSELKVQMTQKYQELRVKSIEKYQEMRAKVTEQYQQLVAKYNELVIKANNFVETTTIAHIVEYAQVKYVELLEKIEETRVELIAAKERYVQQGKALYREYKLKTVEEYKKISVKVEAYYNKHVKPVVEKQRARAMKVYNKYQPIVVAKYTELREKAMVKYNELREKALAKYTELREISQQKYVIYSLKAKEMYTLYMTKGKAYLKKTKEDAYLRWMNSEVRGVLIDIKGMTIRDTIQALKRLPTQTRFLILTQYNKYSSMAQMEFNKRYEQLVREVTLRRQQIQDLARPYTVPAVQAYKWVENEITETAIFVYRYNRIEERSIRLKNFIISEARRLAPIVKTNVQLYAREFNVKSRQMAYDFAAATGDKTLRGIHSGLRYVDNIDFLKIQKDVQKYQKNVQAYFTEFNKYVTIDVVKGEILINIPHPEIEPKISHHMKKLQNKARRSVQKVKLATEKMIKELSVKIAALRARADKLRKQIQQKVLENTVEIRRDMKTSLNVNKKIAQHVYQKAKVISQKIYKQALSKYKVIKQQAKVYIRQLKALSKQQYARFMRMSTKAYLKAGEVLSDIYSVGPFRMHKRAFFHAKKYSALAKRTMKNIYIKHKPTVIRLYRKYSVIAKNKAIQLKRKAMPYYQTVRRAVNQVRAGVPVKKAFKPIYHQLKFASQVYQRKALKKISELKSKTCRRDPKLCKLMKESKRVHARLFEKYSISLMEYVATGKAHFHRAVRKISKCSRKPFWRHTYKVAASLYGDHVLTFDKKYYELIENTKTGCGYLLAHDFSNNQFTLKKERSSIIVETEEMSMTINKDGTTKARIGKEVIKSLPVESKSGKCVRKDSLVICHFLAQNFKVVVDLKHDITTLSISGWYYGKTQGIFGTYNRETYDDWKLPNGQVTNNIYDFLNAYEVSGKAKCQLRAVTKKPKACNQAPSSKCDQIFRESSSPYAQFFDDVKPESFWQLCVADTTVCGKKYDEKSYCKSVAAFVSFARGSGKWIKHLPECMTYKEHEVESEFKQKPLKKAMDVVVIVSQRQSQKKLKKNFIKFMKHLNGMLKNNQKQDIKYTMVGFGGAGIYERAHNKPVGKGYDVFGTIQDLLTDIDELEFNGNDDNTNDAYHAILAASSMHFRPGASKVFVMFTSEPHSAHGEGPAFDEAKYALEKEAEATLIVFDDFKFKKISKRQGQVTGQSTRKLYTTKHWKKGMNRQIELPSSEYKEIVEDTEGAMFQSAMIAPKQVAGSVFDVLQKHVRENTKHCKLCKVHYSWTGAPKVVCQTKEGLKC